MRIPLNQLARFQRGPSDTSGVLGPSSISPYLRPDLRENDAGHYRAAGLLAFRVTEDNGVQVLLTRHMRHRTPGSKDVRQRASTWNLLGGKREEGEESPLVTAAREAEEESGLLLPFDEVHSTMLAKETAVLWIPRAAYVVYIAEICRTDSDCRAKRLCKLRPRELIGAEDIDQSTDTLQWLPWDSLATCPPSRGSPYKKQVVTLDGVLLHPFLAETLQRSATSRRAAWRAVYRTVDNVSNEMAATPWWRSEADFAPPHASSLPTPLPALSPHCALPHADLSRLCDPDGAGC